MKPRPLLRFNVSHNKIRLRVHVFSCAQDVHYATHDSKWRGRAMLTMGSFSSDVAYNSKFTGTIRLAGNCDLNEHIPHEVVHAVLHAYNVHIYEQLAADDEEPIAYAVGVLSARIRRKIERGLEVFPK